MSEAPDPQPEGTNDAEHVDGDDRGEGDDGDPRPQVRRRRLGKRLLVGFLAVTVLVVAYGVAIEPRLILDIEHEEVALPSVPDAWVGEEVVVLADLQVGMWLGNVGMARRAVDEAAERRPAAAVLLGDFVYGEGDVADKVRTVVDVLRPLVDGGIPTYAVLGNHDHATGANVELSRALGAVGIEVLDNEAATIPAPEGPDEGSLHVVGVGAHRPGRDRPRAAVAGVPQDAARLVMMHNPASFPGLPAGSAPVAVAGHTHGGQIRVPFLPEWSFLSLIEDDPVHVDGWIDAGYGAPGNRLYVNRGIGMSLLPARINCPPEVTVLTITRAPQGT